MASNDSHALEVSHLVKDFILPLSRKKVRAVDDLSFTVNEGGIIGFLGSNGAGKTTTLKMIMELIFPTSGFVKIFGRPNSELSIKEKIGFLTERPYFYDYLTGREFLKFCGQLYSDSTHLSRIDGLLEEVGLSHAADRPLRRYSKGMLQRVGIAQAIINNPKLLILDEPMSGLDPDGRAEMGQLILNSHKKGATVLFSTHLLPDVEHLCDRVIMINKGKLVVESPVSELLNSYSKGFEVDLSPKKTQFRDLEKNVYKTDEELQRALSEAIGRGDKVIRVSPGRPSLEEVYMKLKSQSQQDLK
jgi:ABC-2 type transport system ATP-binding protein